MNAGFIVAYILLFALVIGCGIYIFCFYTYSKNTLFSKPKHNMGALILLGFLIALLITTGILYLTVFRNKELKLYAIHAGLSLGLAVIYSVYLILFIVIVNKFSKNKIDYTTVQQVNFPAVLNDLRSRLGDEEEVKQYCLKYHKKYYLNMINKYQELLQKFKDPNNPKSSKIADIVVFNDTFTHKWSSKANQYQILLTIQFLSLI